MEQKIAKEIISELKAKGNAERALSSQHFFKEKLKFYGFKSKEIGDIAKNYYKKYLKEGGKDLAFSVCNILWQGEYFEEKSIACDLCYYFHKEFVPADFKIFETWVKKYVDNWAACDVLCGSSVGDFLMMYPEFVKNVKEWTKSDNRWVKRASAVSFVIPAKKGMFAEDIFWVADALLSDKDDLVQKGYGWMLKVFSQSSEVNQKRVFDYVMKNKKNMPRTSLRYAIEKMPVDMRKEAMR